jgi:hypothetical protein
MPPVHERGIPQHHSSPESCGKITKSEIANRTITKIGCRSGAQKAGGVAALLTLLATTASYIPLATAGNTTPRGGFEMGVSYLHLGEPDDDTRNINVAVSVLYQPVPLLSFGIGIQASLLEMLFESDDNRDITGAPLMFPIFAQLHIPLTRDITLRGRAGRALGLYRYAPGTCSTYFRLNNTSACTDGTYTERHTGDYFGGSLAFSQTNGYSLIIGFNRLQLPNQTRFNLYEIGFQAMID